MDSSNPLRADDPGLTDAVARNLAEAVAQFHRHTPGADLDAAADLVLADSGLADPTFNAVACARLDPSAARARIAQVVTRMAQTGRPFTWWVDPGATPADLGARLRAAGLEPAQSVPVLVRSLRTPLGPVRAGVAPGASGLEISEVLTAAQWADFAEVLLSCFTPPRTPVRGFLRDARLSALAPDGSGRYLVGYADGVPVCTAEALLHAGVAGLYNIVTLPGHQRRGYATRMTMAALELARDAGYHAAALEASPQGEPVYLRLGFEPVGHCAIYALG